MIAVPLVPPPPPPLPAVNPPPDSWHLPYPIMYLSWGPMLDSTWRDSDAGLRKIVEAGMRTVAFQGGQFKAIHAQWARDLGLDVAVWGSPSSQDASFLQLADASGYIVQVETPDEYRQAVINLEAGVGAGLSIAMVTTFGGLLTYTSRNVGTVSEHPTTVETEVLAKAGCTHAQVECYMGDMTPMSVEQMMFTGEKWRGVYYSKPVIGLAGRPEYSVGSYQPAIDAYGRQFGVYLAEPMRAIDWQAVKAL